MRIAHISDLHLDKNYKKDNLINTLKLLEYISDSDFDHVIITGDITENAESSAFELARSLFKKHGLLDPDKLTLTIGNHDIYGGVHLAEDIVNYPGKCRSTNYQVKVQEFAYYFRESFANERIIKPGTGHVFPFIKEFDDFILAGLNSIAEYSMLKNPFASNGKIGFRQIEAIQNTLSKNKLNNKRIIALTHHHFCKDNIVPVIDSTSIWKTVEKQTMKLRDKKRILKQLREIGAGIVLHGHLHESAEYERKGIRFLNSGGTLLSENSDVMKINILEINSSTLDNEFLLIPKVTLSNPLKFLPQPPFNYFQPITHNEISMN